MVLLHGLSQLLALLLCLTKCQIKQGKEDWHRSPENDFVQTKFHLVSKWQSLRSEMMFILIKVSSGSAEGGNTMGVPPAAHWSQLLHFQCYERYNLGVAGDILAMHSNHRPRTQPSGFHFSVVFVGGTIPLTSLHCCEMVLYTRSNLQRERKRSSRLPT